MTTTSAIAYALEHTDIPAGKKLWLYGRPRPGDDHYQPWHSVTTPQAYRDLADIPGRYEAILIDCPKHHEETQGLLAWALRRSDGFVMAAAANDAGGNRLKKMLEAYGVETHMLSKHHCRVVWTGEAAKADTARIQAALSNLAPRLLSLGGYNWWTVPGLFGWNKIDAGSALLLEYLPQDLHGAVADFGCGYGYVSVMMEQRFPGIARIDAFDANARAVACCARNTGTKVMAHWQDIRSLPVQKRYDAVVMNPPFHSGKGEDTMLGRDFIAKAWECLLPEGQLWFVANRHLPYEHTVPGLRVVHETNLYKIIAGTHP